MDSILITGCNRGLGLGLVKVLIRQANPPKHIFATCRNVDQADELKSIADQNQNVHVLQIDLKNFDSYDTLAKQVSDVVKDKGLNVLFNNAGIFPKSTGLNVTKVDDLMETFSTNTVAPIMLAKAFVPLLKKAAQANPGAPMGIQKAVIINISSILGSIGSNVEGGYYEYRITKSGLNAATKSMSIDLRVNEIMAISMHPGWVKTDMGGSKAPLDIDTSCTKMVETLYNLNESQNGTLIQYNGKQLPF